MREHHDHPGHPDHAGDGTVHSAANAAPATARPRPTPGGAAAAPEPGAAVPVSACVVSLVLGGLAVPDAEPAAGPPPHHHPGSVPRLGRRDRHRPAASKGRRAPSARRGCRDQRATAAAGGSESRR